ncbi:MULTISPECIES: energy transducer TonB [unclassified Anabaena]|uniref:energy transducer TonB n=1 Tax=unclassified Anabaena TaxID=2619674 RepID=UPI0039C6D2CA
MSFSGITVKHRSQEVEALKSFLIYSLIGSLALHIGVLASGIGNLLVRTPEEEYAPIELAIIDPPTEEPEKPPEVIPEEAKPPQPRQIITRNEIPVSPAKTEIVQESQPQIAPQPPVVAAKQPLVTPPEPKVESVEKPPVQPQPVQQQLQPQPTTTTTEKPEPTNVPRQEAVAKLESLLTSESSPSTIAVAPTNQGNEKLRESLSGLRDSRATQSSNTNTVDSNAVPRQTTATSTNNTRVPRSPIAAAPTAPQIPNPGSNSSGSGDGRAACTQCRTNYPEFAKRRGIEGRVEVAVDTDAKGNVTNVRIVNSSGNSRLDEETVRQARNWKLKPSEGGRQGVSIATDYAIQGSQRHRQVQERKKQQEAQAQQRSRQTAAPSSSNPPAPTTSEPRVRARREPTPAVNPAPTSSPTTTTPVRQPRQPVQNTATGSSSGTRTTPTPSQGNVRDSLRSVQRQRTSTTSAPAKPAAKPAPAPRPAAKPAPAANTNRRPRPTANTPPPANTPSPSQNNLRDSLRRSRQSAPSQPAATPETAGQE